MTPTELTERLVDRFADRASDWFNPILVKETRQALKSRQFIATFLLLLAVSWCVSLFYVYGATGHASAPGRQLFSFYYFIFAVTILVIVPFNAYRSLQTEREQHSYEVLSVTTLKPRQIFLGKLGSAIVQTFIFGSALMPFIALTYLLRGIDFPTIAYLLAVGFVESMAISLVAWTASTFASQRQWQIVSMIGLLWLLVMLVGMTVQVVNESLRGSQQFHDPQFWFANTAALVVILGYGLLLEQIAVAQLTFDSDNRSSGVRIVITGLQLLIMSVPLVEWLWLGSLRSMSEQLVLFAMAQLGLVGIFLVTEPDRLSHRLQRNLGRMGMLRVPALVYYPGGSRGLMYVIAHLGMLFGVAYFVDSLLGAKSLVSGISGSGIGSKEDWDRLQILSQYLLIYLGGAAAISRAGRAIFTEFRPGIARVLATVLVGVLAMIPVIIEEARILPEAKRWVAVLNPAFLLDELAKVNHGREGRLLLAIWCGLALLVNLPGIVRAIFETLGASAKRPTESVAVPSA